MKTLLFLPATSLAVLAAVWLCSPKPSGEHGECVPVVQLHLGAHPLGDVLSVNVPVPPKAPGTEVEWSMVRLEVNGRDFTSWSWSGDVDADHEHYGLQSLAMQKALRARFGNRLQLPEPELTKPSSPSRTLIDARDKTGRLDLDFTMRESLIGFEVSGELPLKPGASLRQGDLLWSMELEPAELSGDGPYMNLSLRSPYLWLGSFKPEADLAYRFFLLQGTDRIRQLGGWWNGPPGPRGKGKLRQFEIRLHDFGITGAGGWPDDLRLVIVRPVVLSRANYSWKSPAPIQSVGRSAREEDPLPDFGPDAGIAWLKDHPAPAGTATGDEVSAWLSGFFQRISSYDRGSEVYPDALGEVVRAHPDRLMRAIKALPESGYAAKSVGHMAIKRYLQRDAVQRFPEVMEDFFIRYTYAEKGWAADVVPYQAQQTRLGSFDANVMWVLLQAPEATGFSEAEWLALFRLYPEGYVFRALNGQFIRKELLEEEVDRLLDGFTVPAAGSDASYFPDLMNLALARGRAEAPQWLATWIPRWQAEGAGNPRAVTVALATYFELPAEAHSDKAAIEWFMAKDPAAFVFDPASGKYRLP